VHLPCFSFGLFILAVPFLVGSRATCPTWLSTMVRTAPVDLVAVVTDPEKSAYFNGQARQHPNTGCVCSSQASNLARRLLRTGPKTEPPPLTARLCQHRPECTPRAPARSCFLQVERSVDGNVRQMWLSNSKPRIDAALGLRNPIDADTCSRDNAILTCFMPWNGCRPSRIASHSWNDTPAESAAEWSRVSWQSFRPFSHWSPHADVNSMIL